MNNLPELLKIENQRIILFWLIQYVGFRETDAPRNIRAYSLQGSEEQPRDYSDQNKISDGSKP